MQLHTAQARPSREVSLQVEMAWPYDEALRFFAEQEARVVAGGPMTLAVGEHDRDVVSLGRHTPAADVLDEEGLLARGGLVHRVERGGGATAHGPGQLVVYPVISLARLGLDVPGLTSALEDAAVALLAELGVEASASAEDRGVYVRDAKIASVGFRVTRGVVTHGLALNVANDLEVFRLIATCGVRERPMTSVQNEKGGEWNLNDRQHLAFRLARQVASRCMLQLLV